MSTEPTTKTPPVAPVIRAYAAKLDVLDGERAVVARINTDEVDRYGTVIDPAGIDLKAYRTNPVVLWEHGKDPVRGTVPIGRNAWIKCDKGDKSIIAKTIFNDENDEFADGVFRLYQADPPVLRSWSINGQPRAYSAPSPDEVRARPELADARTIYRDTELTEYSSVSVPGNRTALTLAVSRGLWLPENLRRDMDDDEMEESDSALPQKDRKKRYVVHDTERGKWTAHEEDGEELGEYDTQDEAEERVKRYVEHEGDKWCVYAEDGKKMGEYGTKEEAEKRLREIEYFKHKDGERSAVSAEAKRARRLRVLTRTVTLEDGKHFIRTADGKRKLGGPYATKGEAEKRLREDEHLTVSEPDPFASLPPLTGRRFADVLEGTILGVRAETQRIREEEAARRDLSRGIV